MTQAISEPVVGTSRTTTGNAKRTYRFSRSHTDGSGDQKELLGGKGANLAGMMLLGLPVPPGFTITTEVCREFNDAGGTLPDGLMAEVRHQITHMEADTGKTFGGDNPLLVSVRSGAKDSMPGMMDTVLNLGLNDETVEHLARLSGNRRFAFDSYRRLINMFGDVVMGIEHHHFETAFNTVKREFGAKQDTDVPVEGLEKLVEVYKDIYEQNVGAPFPQDPFEQLELAIIAVFKSWMGERAVTYRTLQGIRGLAGTAVNIQAMVFGNMGDDSGTGVAFTRNPATGENALYCDFLVNAQGEDVVAGIRTPVDVSEMARWNRSAYEELMRIRGVLEQHYRDMQDIEFTIERGTFYMLQTRNGKRNGVAAVRVAVEMVRSGLITIPEALVRVPANDLSQLLFHGFDASAKKQATLLTKGIAASPGAARGKIAFASDEVVRRKEEGNEVCILVRHETAPEDVAGMHVAAGILTSTGGKTSHAAVVARGWGKCCVVGAGELDIDPVGRTVTIGDRVLRDFDEISIDGGTGEVFLGAVPTVEPVLDENFAQLMEWTTSYSTLVVRTNADTPADARKAREFGAQGIGLTRTEHMFFGKERIADMRRMILADTPEARAEALARILPHQRQDFADIFRAMAGLPVTIRLLDPPLHEFLPHEEQAQIELAQLLDVDVERVRSRVKKLHEVNPMMGFRGCRLSIVYPEILEMQVRAIVEAAIECARTGVKARPEIMHPLVGTAAELKILRAETKQVIARVKAELGFEAGIEIPIGTMIEVPRAALTADEIVEHADFYSFGTNDLTQLTFGYSRDDSASFLPMYSRRDILPTDPFQSIDENGVGKLIRLAVTSSRSVKADFKCGICGEHGGDPTSVEFCHAVGLDYVSCSPYRVPVARLAAAQATIKAGRVKGA